MGKEKPAYLAEVERLIGRCIIKLATSEDVQVDGRSAVIKLAQDVLNLSQMQQTTHDPLNITYFHNFLLSDRPLSLPTHVEEEDSKNDETSKPSSFLHSDQFLLSVLGWTKLNATWCRVVSCASCAPLWIGSIDTRPSLAMLPRNLVLRCSSN